MIHANRMGNFVAEHDTMGLENSERQRERMRQKKYHCVVCGEIVADKSTTCRKCINPWKAIKADPTAIAEWIAEAAVTPEFQGRKIVVWGERPEE